MIAMLGEKDFEHITITELCRAAEISRITFYSHYSDKYALLDEIFDDMLKLGTEDYYRRQRENNPIGRLAAGYVNMLDAILQLYSDRFDFFRHTDPEKNPYLASSCSFIQTGLISSGIQIRRRIPTWRPGCTASSWRRWSSIHCM